MIIVFYISAVIALASTIMVVVVKNAVHSLLYLVVSLLAVAVIFYVIGAPFIAALEVIVYAGAIMVLFVFVMMMLNLGSESKAFEESLFYPGIWVGPVILVVILLGQIAFLLFENPAGQVDMAVIESREVGIALYGAYIIGVELAGFLLLAGIVGAYHIGHRKRKSYHRFLQNNGGDE
jgi:NADH-quinone oxidoreductase subunit J